MIPKIKSIYSTEIHNLESYKPEISDNFGFNLRLLIGPKGEYGEESFDLFVCTLKWLLENYNREDILFLRHKCIIFSYDYAALIKRVERLVHSCAGNDWKICAEKLSKFTHWEFEDYDNDK